MKGLRVNIYRGNYNSPINALEEAEAATLIDADVVELFEPSDGAPAIRLVRRNLWGEEYIHAEPMEKGSYAFGGSFIYSSDSRFREINKYPIPLHDRDMSKE